MERYFESAYLSHEMIPDQNRGFILGTFQELEELEEHEPYVWKYSETSDYYFRQRPIGGARPVPVSGLRMMPAELMTTLLEHQLVRQEGIGFIPDQYMDDYRQLIERAVCYSNASYALFFNAEGDRVTDIWFDYSEDVSLESDRLAMARLLHHLGVKYALILADWYEKRIIDLSDPHDVTGYLAFLANQPPGTETDEL